MGLEWLGWGFRAFAKCHKYTLRNPKFADLGEGNVIGARWGVGGGIIRDWGLGGAGVGGDGGGVASCGGPYFTSFPEKFGRVSSLGFRLA